MRIIYLVLLISTFLYPNSRDALYTSWQDYMSIFKDAKYKDVLNDKNSSFDYANIHAKKGGILKQYEVGGFDSFNPYILKGNSTYSVDVVFESLMSQSQDEPYSMYPLLANKISLAKDGSGARFSINKLARFSDGKSVTSKDVLFSFATLKEFGSPNILRYYSGIKEVRIISSNIVEFIFNDSKNHEMPFISASMPIFPKHYYLKDSKNTFANSNTLPRGSGPYILDKFEINKKIIYKKNANYWGKNLFVNRGLYNFNKISIDYFKDDNVALQAFLAHSYDYRIESSAKVWANGYQGSALRDGKFSKLLIVHSIPSGMQAFYLNTRRKLLKDIDFREALMQAFDFEWSNKYLFYSQYKRTKSFFENSPYASKDIPKGLEKKILSQYKDSNLDMFKKPYSIPSTDFPSSKRKNLKYATKLLLKQGFTYKDGLLLDKSLNPIRLTLLLNGTLFEKVALVFKKNLAILGITLDIKVVDGAQYQNLVRDFNYDIIVGVIPQGQYPGKEEEVYFSSKSADIKGSLNYSGVKDKSIDLLLARLNKTHDIDLRVAILKSVDRILLWGNYVIPHFYAPSFRLAVWNNIAMPNIWPKYSVNPYLWWENDEKTSN